jgi:mono/diheme cytochrome c family protein
MERGRYVAQQVAMCVQCHSPRNERGELQQASLFDGGPIPFKSPFPGQNWAFAAPRIAGLPGWDANEVVKLLRTGRDSTGWSPRPPMPPFRLSEEDAKAVVAYLKSLR